MAWEAVVMGAYRADDADRCRLADRAHQQQRDIDTILDRVDTPKGWRRLYRWRTRPADPELAKNLLIFRGLIGEAAELCQRRGLSDDQHCRLVTAMTLPDQAARTLKVLLASRFQLEQLLLELADRTYLTGRLACLYGEGTGTYVTWKGMFGDSLPVLLDPGDADTRHQDMPPDATAAGQPVEPVTTCLTCAAVINYEVERARLQLIRLLREKEAQDQVTRARHELIDRAMPMTAFTVAVMASALAAIAFWTLHHGELLVLALVSGGTGAALGGLIKLRDQIQWGTQARRFFPVFICQVLIGSIAGTLAFLISQTGAKVLATQDARVAVLALALGFSEAAFLSLLTRFVDPKIT